MQITANKNTFAEFRPVEFTVVLKKSMDLKTCDCLNKLSRAILETDPNVRQIDIKSCYSSKGE
jgi:hypothetical protein